MIVAFAIVLAAVHVSPISTGRRMVCRPRGARKRISPAGNATVVCGWLKSQSGNDDGKSLGRDPVRARS
jgi:hypothetical protein